MANRDETADRTPVGVMLVGALGMTATAVSGGILAMKRGVVPEQYGVTGHPGFAAIPLVSATDLELGGWDFRSPSLAEALRGYGHLPQEVIDSVVDDDITVNPGLWSPFDFPFEGDNEFVREPTSLAEGAGIVADDISTFRAARGVSEVIVIFLGTPGRQAGLGAGWDLDSSHREVAPAGAMYAMGAADAGAHFVDFTPSETLDAQAIWRYAEASGVQIAGRDGSTGQTMLKVTIAEMLARRGIQVDAWYSTNLIGNRDGLVLSQPDYAAPKIADKTEALHTPRPGFHNVAIEYLPPWGDAKEAWDAVECSTWLGAPLSIRINWRGRDSQLAAAMVLDLVRLVHRGTVLGLSGFQPQLGFFFKRPYLREETAISERWDELVGFYA